MAVKQLGRFRCTDGMGVGSSRAVPIRDQELEPEGEGELVCRVMQTGADTWAGHDARGRTLRISRSKDGALEIRHMAETTGDDELEGVTGMRPPGATGDPKDNFGGRRTGDALAAYQRTGKARFHTRALGDYQRRLDEHYGNRR